MTRRLARRGGVVRIQKEIYDSIRDVLRAELQKVRLHTRCSRDWPSDGPIQIIGKIVALFGGTDEDNVRANAGLGIRERGRKVRLSLLGGETDR